jgi:hypothetical protein
MPMRRFAIDHLNPDQLREAWPVVRMSDSLANCDWWMSEAAQLIERGGVILAARATDGNIYGVATYAVAKKPLVGRVLTVGTLITFELSRRAPARHALHEALELLANAFDCRSIVLPLPSKAQLQHRAKALFGVRQFNQQPHTP